MNHSSNPPVVGDTVEPFTPSPPPPQPANVVDGDFRPRVPLPGDGNLMDSFAEDYGKELAKTGKFFHRGDREGKTLLFLDEDAESLVPISPTQLVTVGEQYVVCWKFANGKTVDCSMTKSQAELLMAARSFFKQFPEIKRENRVRLPKWSDKQGAPGVELQAPGYDAAEKTYTFVDVEYEPDMPVEKGLKLIAKWLRDVAYDVADELRSRAATLAMMFTVFCDQLLSDKSHRPAFIITGNTEGAGKTLLAKMAIAIVHGSVSTTAPPAREKMAETLHAIARAGKPYLLFDNWKRGEISDADLEAFLSSTRWHGRVIGLGSLFDVEKRCLVFITGNNATVGPDMRRRSIIINLFVEDVRAENRKVSRPLEIEDILANRGELLAAMWACVRFWSDRTNFYRGKENRSFTEWSDIIGGIVQCICSGQSPLASPRIGHDIRLANWEKFIVGLDDTHLDSWLKYSELLDLARDSELFSDCLARPGEEVDHKSENSKFSKGYLRRFVGRRFDFKDRSLWFTDNGQSGRDIRYMVSRERPVNTETSC
jgi:hypothetical protein